MGQRSFLDGRTLLCIVTLGFALTMGISFLNLRKYDEISQIELSDTTWVVAQTRYEFLRFLDALNRYMLPSDEVSKEDLLHRLDILWSRLPIFLEGPESARYGAVPGLQDAVRRLDAALGFIEPNLKALSKDDVATYKELRAAFERQSQPLDGLIVNALIRDEGRTVF